MVDTTRRDVRRILMDWYYLAAFLFGSMIVLLLTGLPVAFSIGIVSALVLVATLGIPGALSITGNTFYRLGSDYVLVAIPMFVLMAQILTYSGTIDDLFDLGSKWFGGVSGGLAIGTIAASAVFGSLCGASVAAVAAIGKVAIPQMLRRGYHPALAVGSVGAGGGLVNLIPPSIIMLVYSILAEQSPGRMFIAGVIPGILLAVAMAGFVVVRVTLNPNLAPKQPGVSWRTKGAALRKLMGPGCVALAILASIYLGIATATEAAAIGCVASLGLWVASGRFKFNLLFSALVDASKTTSFIFAIIVAGTLFSFVLSYLQISQSFVRLVTETFTSPWGALIAIQVMYIFLGCFLDTTSMLIITLPVVLPIVHLLGFDLVWFGILYVINTEMALVTPPVGFNLFVLRGIVPKGIGMGTIIRGSTPFVVCDLIVLGATMLFPSLALWLPGRMMQ